MIHSQRRIVNAYKNMDQNANRTYNCHKYSHSPCHLRSVYSIQGNPCLYRIPHILDGLFYCPFFFYSFFLISKNLILNMHPYFITYQLPRFFTANLPCHNSNIFFHCKLPPFFPICAVIFLQSHSLMWKMTIPVILPENTPSILPLFLQAPFFPLW